MVYALAVGLVFIWLGAISVTRFFSSNLESINRNHDSKIVRMSQFPFTLWFLGGSLLLNVSALFFLGETTSLLCHLRAWLIAPAFTLVLAPLLVKTWRLVLIFNNPHLEEVRISGLQLALACAAFLLVFIFLF